MRSRREIETDADAPRAYDSLVERLILEVLLDIREELIRKRGI